MRGEQSLWTDERIALLRKWWSEGAPASAIAVQLGGGISRSAVLGKINRLRRLASGAMPSKAQSHGTTLRESPDDLGSAAPARRRSKQVDQPERFNQTAKTCGKRLLELTNDSCRFPLGNPGTARFRFCGAGGAAVDLGVPYCPRHMRRAYLAPLHPRAKTKISLVPTGQPAAALPNAASSREHVSSPRVRNPVTRRGRQ
jgi:GcrA cell cycle regulator